MKKTMVELARELYTQENYNCSETVLRAANAYYGLNLSDHEMVLVGGFGGGLYAGKACGALCGAVAVISKLLIDDRAKQTEGFSKTCAKLTESFEAKLGHVDCAVLKPLNHTPDVKCFPTIEASIHVLEAFIADNVPAERMPQK